MKSRKLTKSKPVTPMKQDNDLSSEKTVKVSARIPISLRDDAADILRRHGFSQTDLIHAAYEFVLYRQALIDSQPVSERRERKTTHIPTVEPQSTEPDDRELLTSILIERYFGISDETE